MREGRSTFALLFHLISRKEEPRKKRLNQPYCLNLQLHIIGKRVQIDLKISLIIHKEKKKTLQLFASTDEAVQSLSFYLRVQKISTHVQTWEDAR